METFHDALRAVRTTDWDFLAKLDGDLTVAPDFFEKCLGHFQANPKLGIGGGMICNEEAGSLVEDAWYKLAQ